MLGFTWKCQFRAHIKNAFILACDGNGGDKMCEAMGQGLLGKFLPFAHVFDEVLGENLRPSMPALGNVLLFVNDNINHNYDDDDDKQFKHNNNAVDNYGEFFFVWIQIKTLKP